MSFIYLSRSHKSPQHTHTLYLFSVLSFFINYKSQLFKGVSWYLPTVSTLYFGQITPSVAAPYPFPPTPRYSIYFNTYHINTTSIMSAQKYQEVFTQLTDRKVYSIFSAGKHQTGNDCRLWDGVTIPSVFYPSTALCSNKCWTNWVDPSVTTVYLTNDYRMTISNRTTVKRCTA
jgi:hypothetical protein